MLSEPPVSQPYIDMTLHLMGLFGIRVTREGDTYKVPKGCYVNPPSVHVEADASSATYPLAIADEYRRDAAEMRPRCGREIAASYTRYISPTSTGEM